MTSQNYLFYFFNLKNMTKTTKYIIGTTLAITLSSIFLWLNTAEAFWWERWRWFWWDKMWMWSNCPMFSSWSWSEIKQQMQQVHDQIRTIRSDTSLTDEQKTSKILEIMNTEYAKKIDLIKNNEYLSDKWKQLSLSQMEINHNKMLESVKSWSWFSLFDKNKSKKWERRWGWKWRNVSRNWENITWSWDSLFNNLMFWKR